MRHRNILSQNWGFEAPVKKDFPLEWGLTGIWEAIFSDGGEPEHNK